VNGTATHSCTLSPSHSSPAWRTATSAFAAEFGTALAVAGDPYAAKAIAGFGATGATASATKEAPFGPRPDTAMP
jgi:hypothetical protein